MVRPAPGGNYGRKDEYLGEALGDEAFQNKPRPAGTANMPTANQHGLLREHLAGLCIGSLNSTGSEESALCAICEPLRLLL
jgi:hypothetical protein